MRPLRRAVFVPFMVIGKLRSGRLLAALFLALFLTVLMLPLEGLYGRSVGSMYRAGAAIDAVGVLHASRCLSGRFAYDPSRGEHADSTFINVPPEQAAVAFLTGEGRQVIDVERVEVNVQAPRATVRVKIRAGNGSTTVRSVRLAGGGNSTMKGFFADEYPPCWEQIGDWRVLSGG